MISTEEKFVARGYVPVRKVGGLPNFLEVTVTLVPVLGSAYTPVFGPRLEGAFGETQKRDVCHVLDKLCSDQISLVGNEGDFIPGAVVEVDAGNATDQELSKHSDAVIRTMRTLAALLLMRRSSFGYAVLILDRAASTAGVDRELCVEQIPVRIGGIVVMSNVSIALVGKSPRALDILIHMPLRNVAAKIPGLKPE